MFRKVQQQKYMIFLRYGYILLFLLSFGKEYKNIGSLEIIFLLTYIINNQLRYFILPEGNTYIVPSLILEIWLGYKLYILAGNFGGLIFVLSLIDIIYMFKKVHTLIYIRNNNIDNYSKEFRTADKLAYSSFTYIFIISKSKRWRRKKVRGSKLIW